MLSILMRFIALLSTLSAVMTLPGCATSTSRGHIVTPTAVDNGTSNVAKDGDNRVAPALVGRLPKGVTFTSTVDGGHYLGLSVADARKLLVPRRNQTATAVASWARQADTAAVINGGYFYSNAPLSLVVAAGERLADNISAVTRNNQSFPVLRSALWIGESGEAEMGWVGVDDASELRAFVEPMPYQSDQATPLAPPPETSGSVISPVWAIGGGPRLLQGGEVAITYNEEVFWGSGVELHDVRPRTAICITGNDKLLLYVNEGVRLDALPKMLHALGCVDAMNLDGGGSSAMYVEGRSILDQQRAVPVVLAIRAAR